MEKVKRNAKRAAPDDGAAQLAPGAFDVKVDGHNMTINTKKVCEIENVQEDMGKVAAEIAYYGSLLGSAERARDYAQSTYRSWKATTLTQIMSSDPKMAEWKAKAIVEADPKFLQFKDKISEYTGMYTKLYWLCRALGHKSEALRSLNAAERSQAQASRMAVS